MFGQPRVLTKPPTFTALELAFQRLKEHLEASARGELKKKDKVFISAEQCLRANNRAWDDISTSRSYVAKEGLRLDREKILEQHRSEFTSGRYAELLAGHPEANALLAKLWPNTDL